MEMNGNNSHHKDESSNRHGADTESPNSVDDNDVQWEKNFERIEELEALFTHLPAGRKQVAKVYAIFSGMESIGEYNTSYVGPMVLAKNVPLKKFKKWIRQECGLHKSIRLETGTVYTPQACVPDHGRLRARFSRDIFFPILRNSIMGTEVLTTGSGAVGDKNPDVFWHLPDQDADKASVLIEVGVSQSLPSLRRRAFELCADGNWVGLKYVVLVKRFRKRIYVEVWRRAPPHAADNVNVLDGLMQDPSDDNLTLGGTMAYGGGAHASEAGFRAADVPPDYQWQLGLLAICSLRAGNEIVMNGPAVPINANVLLRVCRYDDQLK